MTPDQNLTSNRTRTPLVETAALIIIIVLVLLFLVRPQSSVLSGQKDQLQQAQSAYQNVQQEKDALAQLVNKVNQSQADLALVDEALPLVNRPTQVEVLLDNLVAAAGMKTVELSFQPQNTISAGGKSLLTDPYGTDRKLVPTSVDLSVTGGMDQFKYLLQLIETNGRVMDISNIDMTNDQKATSFKLKLKAYSYVP
jgi:Tfp pilus assembly protein PilO